MNIKGILLDADGTLVRPTGGSYRPGPYFREIIEEYGVQGIDWAKLDEACEEGDKYLENNHQVMTEDEEREQLSQYYGITLKCMGISEPPDDLLQKLADAAVDKLEMELFPEAESFLEGIGQKSVKLYVVANGWPSLERKFDELGIGEYFDGFVISSQIGCFKPAEPIYRAAMEKVGLPAEELLFVDDEAECVKKAGEMGMAGAVINRININEVPGIPTINNLNEIEAVLEYYEENA